MPKAALPEIFASVKTREFVRIPVAVKKNGAAFNPTVDAVHMAFLPAGTDPSTEWILGSWETEGSKYLARCEIGPGTGAVLAKGTYVVWLRITDSPEIPVRDVAKLKVY